VAAARVEAPATAPALDLNALPLEAAPSASATGEANPPSWALRRPPAAAKAPPAAAPAAAKSAAPAAAVPKPSWKHDPGF
jgi:hypothetical protein